MGFALSLMRFQLSVKRFPLSVKRFPLSREGRVTYITVTCLLRMRIRDMLIK